MLAGLDQGGSEADSPVTRHRLHQHSDPAAETPPHPPTPAAAVSLQFAAHNLFSYEIGAD